ncbi:hypothetical protein L6164_025856 [Bauhinia variegata]|uniref:Uncharacterized protein n=1 Tax=Bauhinia variegata TaxID=167791 RepID=A0ACB9M3E9_BAUVA|nr:hypothetical protein L6164_025856 [Bauhinia variegata]
MVLGIRSKSRKSVSVQVHFVIHVQEIKPWLPSKSLKSAQSVILQWENGDQNYGSFASSAVDGKLEFNETLRFSALLRRGSSKIGRHRDHNGFHKNLLEFYLYDIHNGKSAKNQLLGSATINLADYGIIKETTAISIPVNFKKSSKNSAQPFLYLSVQPFDIGSSSSSPNSSLSKELSIDKEESESPPLSPNYENDEDLEIASFTDDESEDVSSISSQTVQSTPEITGDSTGISIEGTKGPNREFILPLETASTSSLVKAEAEPIKQLNGIKSPMSSTVVSSDMGKNAVNESIHQSSQKNITRDAEDKVISSTSYIPVDVPSNTENSFQSEMIREVSWRGQRFNKHGLEKVNNSSNAGILEGKEEKEQKEKGKEEKISMSNKLVEKVVPNLSENNSTRKGKLKIVTVPLSKESHEQPTSVLNMDDKTEDGKSHKLPIVTDENNRLFSRNQAMDLGEENSALKHSHKGAAWRGQRFNKDGLEKVSSSSNAGILEGKEEKEQKEKGVEEKISMSNKLVEKVVLNLSEDDSIRKGKLKSVTVPLSRESHKQPTSILNMDDKTEDGKSHKLPSDTAKNNRLFSRNQAMDLGEENSALKHSHRGAAWRGQRFNKDGLEKVSSSSSAGIFEGKEEKEQKEKGEEEKISMSNNRVEKVILNLSEDNSIRKGKLKSVTVPLSREAHELATSILNMDDKTEDGKPHKLPLDTAKNNRLFSKNQAMDLGEENNALKDSHEGAVCHAGPTDDIRNQAMDQGDENSALKDSHKGAVCYAGPDINDSRNQANQGEENSALKNSHKGAVCHACPGINDSFLNNRAEMKSEVEMLREELREAASLEVSLYSVVADHGSSANKVHTPARRLSRFYFHAYKVGSPATRASAAQSAVSGFVLVSKACGNDVPRLTFWLSNLIALRAILSKGVEKLQPAEVPCISSECDGSGSVEGSSLKRSRPHNTEEKENTVNYFCNWEDPNFFLIALEKVEAWIFSRIVESVWWQTLTPHMQSAAAKSSGSKKIYGRKNSIVDQEQGNFSIDLWKRAFKDALERLCPLRGVGHECGCLPVIARLVMEQLINRLDVAMFNAILRESDEEMPTDPISDPISDSKVLPIPAGKSGFGAGVQLKNVIGNWSRWLSDLFVIDDSESAEDKNENADKKSPECHTSFKPFHLLNALSDLMMLPFEMLTDGSTRKEVCPRFGVALIKRVLYNFVPDEFCPGPIPDAVFEALDAEDLEDDEGSTSFPCMAASTLYSPPPAASVMSILQEVGGHLLLRSGSSVLKKANTSDDELDELDSPFSAAAIDDLSVVSTAKKGRDVVRYKLLRQVWKNSG